jgi:hypothetical protein
MRNNVVEYDFRELGIGCTVRGKTHVEYFCDGEPLFFNATPSCFCVVFFCLFFCSRQRFFDFFEDREMR